MKNITIYIDESGTLPDKADRLVVVAAVSTTSPSSLSQPKKLARRFLENKKEGRSIADTPENFALLCWLLLEECQFFQGGEIKEVMFDRTLYLLLNRRDLIFVHEDSQKVPQINTADMVAGSYLWFKKGKTDKFYKIIKNKVISEKTVTWKQIRTRFWNKKLNRTGAGAHPG